MKSLYKSVKREEINQKAQVLYNSLKNTMGIKPGFNIDEIVEKLGGTVKDDKDCKLPLGIDSEIEIDDTKDNLGFEITHATGRDKMYVRYCIAHELGHLFLHMLCIKDDELVVKERSCYKTGNEEDEYTLSLDLKEWEADEFASAFLMPEDEFRQAINECNGDVEKIAKKFQVSTQNVVARYNRL